MQSTFFDQPLSRLKKALGVREDQEAALALGMSKAAFSARKTRGSFPEKELRALAQRRPELGIDVEYVLTGASLTGRQQQLLDAAAQATKGANLSAADEAALQEQVKGARTATAAGNARQRSARVMLEAVLEDCSDETLELIVQIATKLRSGDVAQRQLARNLFSTGGQ